MAGIDNNTLLYLRGDSFNDLSLYNNSNLINKGTATITDKSIRFNDQYMIINHSSVVSFASPTTIEFDIVFKGFTYDNCIFSKGHIHGQSVADYELALENEKLKLMVGIGSGTTSCDVYYFNHSIVLDKKYHIAYVYDGGYKHSLYIDGVLVGTHTSKYKPSSTKNLYIGNRQSLDYVANHLISNFRISNIARYAGNFVSPNQPYSSITIDITNQTDTQIDFAISKLGQETINKVEVLVNNVLSKTYDTIGDLTYSIDKTLLSNGNNKIKIKVTFDNDYIEEKEIDYEYKIDKLPTSSSLKELIDRQELLTNVIEAQKNTLKSILESKNVEVSEEEKLLYLINKVEDLPDMEIINQLQEGQVKVENKITSLEQESKLLKEELAQIQASIASLTSLMETTLEN